MFGWIPSPPKDTDKKYEDVKHIFSAASAATSTEEHLIDEYTPVENQGGTSSCVAHGTTAAVEILMGVANKDSVKQFSRLFVYYNARLIDRDTDKDRGTYIRNAFDSLSRFGVCLEENWNFDVDRLFLQPSINAYKQADDNKIDAYYLIGTSGDDRLDDIISAVKANHPVVFGTPVSRTFCGGGGVDKVWDCPTSDIAGGHCMVVTGYRMSGNEPQFLIRNSWGESWGKAAGRPGHTWFSAQYMKAKATEDIWVPTNVPALVL